MVGLGGAEDRGRLGGAEGAQADPVAKVADEAVEAALVEALGGEQQVHAEAATHPADGDEQVQELRAGGQELAELVDDDQQVWQRLESRVSLAPGRVGAEVWLVAGQVQESPAPGQFAFEGGHGPVDHGQVGMQVGDETRYLGQRGQIGERGAALEVDQHERELLRRVGGGQPGDDGS